MDTSESKREILGRFEMWCWRRKEKIIWTELVKQVLRRVKEKRNILHIKRTKVNWICHILSRNCHLKHIIGGKRRDEKTRKKT
jgi:hypothetical protein